MATPMFVFTIAAIFPGNSRIASRIRDGAFEQPSVRMNLFAKDCGCVADQPQRFAKDGVWKIGKGSVWKKSRTTEARRHRGRKENVFPILCASVPRWFNPFQTYFKLDHPRKSHRGGCLTLLRLVEDDTAALRPASICRI